MPRAIILALGLLFGAAVAHAQAPAPDARVGRPATPQRADAGAVAAPRTPDAAVDADAAQAALDGAAPLADAGAGAPTVGATATDAGDPDGAAAQAPIAVDAVDAGRGPIIVVPSLPIDAGPPRVGPRVPARTTPPSAAARVERHDSTAVVIKTILGLAALLALAYAGAHPKVKRIEEVLGLSQVITAGFPFVALGLVARLPSVGVLTDEVIAEITPLLLFGLGWLGFQEGCKFDVRTLDHLPSGTALAIILTTSVPFAVIAGASAFLMIQLGEPVSDGTFLRDAVCLGAAGAMTAPRAIAAVVPRVVRDSVPSVDLAERIAQLDDIAGIVALAFLAAYFRPAGHEFTWQIPPLAWLFVALGLGATVGIVIYAMLRRPMTGSEFLAVVLGSVAFAAGMAGYLRLSPIVVGFVAGAVVGNFPFEQKAALRDVLSRLERPVYLLFLMVAGALWDIGDWRGWLFVPVFVVCRFGGRAIAAVAAKRTGAASTPELSEATSVVVPLSMLAIAIVVSAQSLYQGRAIHWIVTAVIAGAIVTEILVQLAVRVFPPAAAPRSNV